SDCDLGLDLSNTVYAVDSTTIDLCLSLFEWASFRSTKAAVKMHTLLDLRGNIPTSFTSATARWATSTCSISCPLKPGPSTSWTVATWTSAHSMGYIRRARSSSLVPNAGWMPADFTQRQTTEPMASSVIRPSP